VAFWLHSLSLKLDYLKPWKLPRIWKAVRAARLNRRRTPSAREIVFVADQPTPRDAKVSQALRDKGWRTVLLLRKTPAFDPSSFFDQVVTFRDAWDALLKASGFTPLAYHVVACWSFRTAATLIRYRPGKMVFDNTDQLGGMVRPEYLRWTFPWQLGLERFCMENADGLRCRDLAPAFARRKLGYKIRGKTLYFPDFGWGKATGAAERPLDGRGVSVAFCGGMAVEKVSKEDRYNLYLEVAKAISAGGVPFHLYATVGLTPGGFEDTFSDYLDWSRRCPDLHVHRPVPPQLVATELSKYSFGLYVWGDPLHLGEDSPIHMPCRKEVTMGSRFYDYVEAGMHIVSHDGRLASWIVRRYGLGFQASRELFTQPRAWLMEQSGRVKRRPGIEQDWVMSRHVGRLETFYRSL
jgi:hypothetical protein